MPTVVNPTNGCKYTWANRDDSIVTMDSTIVCAATGHYTGSGPCTGWKMDLATCERAAENAALAANVRIGQTTEEVRGVMKTHPDRRTGTATSEVWMWLTDYTRKQMTAFVFVDGKVTEIKTVQ